MSPTAVRVTVICPLTLGTSCWGPEGPCRSIAASLAAHGVCRQAPVTGWLRYLPVLPRLNAPGTRVNSERRGTGTLLFLLPAAGATRYRQGELGSGTGGGLSAPVPAGGARSPVLAPAAPVPGPAGSWREPQHSRQSPHRCGTAERKEPPGRARSVLLHRCQTAKANSWGWRGEGANPVSCNRQGVYCGFLHF